METILCSKLDRRMGDAVLSWAASNSLGRNVQPNPIPLTMGSGKAVFQGGVREHSGVAEQKQD